MKNFKCTLLEQGIHIQGEAQTLMGESYPVALLLSYEEASLPWEKAQEWAKEHGGEVPSLALLQELRIHRDEINELLEVAGKESLSGWYWSSTEHNASRALCVNMIGGYVYFYNKGNTSYVRAVSAFDL